MRKLAALFGIITLSACASSSTRALSKSERAQLLLEIANGSLAEGDPTGALQNLVAAEKIDPTLPEIYHSKALAFYAKHDYPAAIVEAKHALKLRPDYDDANDTLGKLLLDTGDYADAVVPLTAAANDPLYRGAYKALTNLGILYYRQSQFAKAKTYFRQATLASPSIACIASYYLGNLSLRESRFKDAIRHYDQATRGFCGGFADAHLAVGIAYQEDRQFDLARKKFLEVQKQYPNTPVADEAISRLRTLP